MKMMGGLELEVFDMITKEKKEAKNKLKILERKIRKLVKDNSDKLIIRKTKVRNLEYVCRKESKRTVKLGRVDNLQASTVVEAENLLWRCQKVVMGFGKNKGGRISQSDAPTMESYWK